MDLQRGRYRMTEVFCGLADCQYYDDGECAKEDINILFPMAVCGDYEQINPEDFREDDKTDEADD